MIDEIGNVAKSNDLVYHLDGARVFNAAVGSDSSVETIGAPFDSISFCLSKGLGCPIGMKGDDLARLWINHPHKRHPRFQKQRRR